MMERRGRHITTRKVFISYSSADRDLANRIADLLSTLSVKFFLDERDIIGGKKIKQTLDQSIAECTHLLVILSPGSLKSIWVPYEVGYASALHLELLPFLEHPKIDVPGYLEDRHCLRNIEEVKMYFSDPEKSVPIHPPINTVIVHKDHTDLPPRSDSLSELKHVLRIFSTTAKNYFLNSKIHSVLQEKLQQGCKFMLLLLAPGSPFMDDRQLQERKSLIYEQRNSILRIRDLELEFPGQIEVRFFNCGPSHQLLAIDDWKAFVSIPLYGVAGTARFPCIEILNSSVGQPVFQEFLDSFDRLWRESGTYSYELISYHDSWVSVDPIIRCSNGCKYCLLRLPGWTGKPPRQLFSPQEAVSDLVSHKYFVGDSTVISVGNRTDPFLRANVGFLLEFLHRLDALSFKNPICLVTKSVIPGKAIAQIGRLRHLRVIIFLSLSGIPKEMEIGVRSRLLKDTFRQLSEARIPVIHFWRPLLPINGSKEQIREMLEFVSQYASSSVVIGLKYSPELRELYKSEPALRIPNDAKLAPYGEWLNPSVQHDLWEVLHDFPEYPVYRHTSCAVSGVLGIPDYNATFHRPDICKGSQCPQSQRGICERGSLRPKKEHIADLMETLGLEIKFTLEKDSLVLHGPIGQEDYIFLLHNTRFPIDASVGFTNVWHGSIFEGTRSVRAN